MKKMLTIVLTSWLLVLLAGCASAPLPTEQELQQGYPEVLRLQTAMGQLQDQDVALLSPRTYQRASDALDKALRLASKGDPKAQEVAAEGQRHWEQAVSSTEYARGVFAEVLALRGNVLAANKHADLDPKFKEADDKLRELGRLLEAGEGVKAKEGRTDLLNQYAELELKAIKRNLLGDTRKALREAEEQQLEKQAPKTMRLAQEQYQHAVNTLNVDRHDVKKAAEHARSAQWQIRRAQQISALSKHFDVSLFSEEDKILWFQEQMQPLVDKLQMHAPFDQSHKDVIDQAVAAVAALQKKNLQLLGQVDRLNQQLLQTQQSGAEEVLAMQEQATLMQLLKEQELTQLREQTEQEKARQAAIARKFEEVQLLFNESEAEVYRRMNDVLIRAHGFSFESGKSEIDTVNFALLNKIINAINKFEGSRVQISGHTDSIGGEAANAKLSQERADRVADFLVQVGQIAAHRVSSQGFGETKPVASNETPEGRAANRRVEILIKNPSLPR